MGLDNDPIPCPCGTHTTREDISRGFTHPKGTPCPLEADGFPRGVAAACCWLRGNIAAFQLRALRKVKLADRMCDDMTAEEATVFATKLMDATDRLEDRYAGTADAPKGAGGDDTWSDGRMERSRDEYSTFEEALGSIREAARWYEKVGRLGFGVKAWF